MKSVRVQDGEGLDALRRGGEREDATMQRCTGMTQLCQSKLEKSAALGQPQRCGWLQARDRQGHAHATRSSYFVLISD